MAQKKEIGSLIQPYKKTLMAILSRSLPPDTNNEQLEAIIDQEIFNFEYLTIFNPALRDCIDESIINAFRKVITQNLSFDQDLGLTYMITRKAKDEEGNEFKYIDNKPSVNGWISIYRQCGSLLDLDTSDIQKDKDTGLITKVTIKLIKPKYDTTGLIRGEEEAPFEFTNEDFKLWQKYSHKQNSTSAKPGVMKTLSLSNENYWNYKPKQKDESDIASPDNPGGINPGFAVTKCVAHALKKAKLERNPYAKRFVTGYQHRKYVEETLLDEDVFEQRTYEPRQYEVSSPDEVQGKVEIKSEEIKHEEVKKEEVKEVKKEEVKKEESKLSLLKKKEILKEIKSKSTSQEMLKVFYKYKDLIDSDNDFKKEIIKIGQNKSKEEEASSSSSKSSETTVENNEKTSTITSNDL